MIENIRILVICIASNMAAVDKSKANAKGKGGLTNEQIVAGFQEMRQQQRAIATKISELEMERKEHEWVPI